MIGRPLAAALGLVLLSSWGAAAAAPRASSGPPPPPHVPAAAQTASPATDPDDGGPTLWLRGPFGRVAGGPLHAPAAIEPLGRPLDAYVKRAPLIVETDDPTLASRIEMTTRPVGSSLETSLARGISAFEGPAGSGVQVIVASVETGDGRIERAWLVDVPDRDPPEDGLYDIPAPAVLVTTASGSRVGTLGDGCYVYLCVETGQPAPHGTLAPLAAAPGETPLLTLADGSGLVSWEGRLTPLGGATQGAREAQGAITDTPASAVPLIGLEPPGRGEWLLQVEIVLDRERGWLQTLYRLVVE